MLHICRASQDGIIGQVKNHLNGSLTLATSTVTYWTRHVQVWEEYLNVEDGTDPQWLFRATPESGMPLLPNGLGQRFEKLAHAAGHPDATLHRLRHTIGTYLVAQGKSCKPAPDSATATSPPPSDYLAELYGLTGDNE